MKTHEFKASGKQVTNGRGSSSTTLTESLIIIIKKLASLREEVEQISKSPISHLEKLRQLKKIEEVEYKTLLKLLAYTEKAEELKSLATILKDLGDLTRHIGDCSIESYKGTVPILYLEPTGLDHKAKIIIQEFIAASVSPLKYYNDAAIFYQYALKIIKKRIGNEQEEEGYGKEIENIYFKLSEIKQSIISLSTDNNNAGNIGVDLNVESEADKNIELLTILRDKAEKQVVEIERYGIDSRELGANEKKKEAAEQEEQYIETARATFKTIAEEMKDFLAKLYIESENEIGNPPCSYSVISLGSLALEQATPYSDFEFAIITENEDYRNSTNLIVREYFKNLSHLVHFKVINLGETIIPTSKYEIEMSHIVHPGVNFDLGGKTPLGRIDRDKPYELIQTVEGMLWYVYNEGNKASHIDKALPYILEKVSYVYGDSKLVEEYQKKVTAFLHKVNEEDSEGRIHCEARALIILKKGITEIDHLSDHKEDKHIVGNIDKLRPELGRDAGRLFNVKQEVYRLPDRLIHDFGMYFGIEGDSVWDTVDKMAQKKIIGLEASRNLKNAITFANILRLKTYSHYKSQQEDLSVFSVNEPDFKASSAFYLSKEDLEIGGAVFRYFYTALPLYTLVRDFCNKYPFLNEIQKKNFFKESSFYTDDHITKGLISYRLAQSQNAIISFQNYASYIQNNREEIDKEKLASCFIEPENVIVTDLDELLFGVEEYNFLAQKNLANAYFLANDYKKAYAVLKAIIDKINFDCLYQLAAPEKLEEVALVLHNAACCLVYEENYHEAINLYEVALSLSRGFEPTLHVNLASCYARAGQFDKSKELFEKATKIPDLISRFHALEQYTSLLLSFKNDQTRVEEAVTCIGEMKKILETHIDHFKAKYGDKYLLLIKLAPLRLQVEVISKKAQLANKSKESEAFPSLYSEIKLLEEEFISISKKISDVPEIRKKIIRIYLEFCEGLSSIVNQQSANSQEELSKLKKAQYYFDEAAKIPDCSQEKIAKTADNLAKTYSNYALCNTSPPILKIKFLERALEIQKKYDLLAFGTLNNLGVEHHNLAERYFSGKDGCQKSYSKALENYTVALSYITDAINSYQTGTSKTYLIETLKNLGMNYGGIGYLRLDVLSLQKVLLCYDTANKINVTDEIVEYQQCLQGKISRVESLFKIILDKLSQIQVNKKDTLGIEIGTNDLESFFLSYYFKKLPFLSFQVMVDKCLILIKGGNIKALKKCIKQEQQNISNIKDFKNADLEDLKKDIAVICKKSENPIIAVEAANSLIEFEIEEFWRFDEREVLGDL